MFTMLSEDFYIIPWETFIRKITMVARARKTKTLDAKKYSFFLQYLKLKIHHFQISHSYCIQYSYPDYICYQKALKSN